MLDESSHLSDRELLLAIDGELAAHDYNRVQQHLTACWSCRAQQQRIEERISSFLGLYRQDLDTKLPSPTAGRALLKAQLTGLVRRPPARASRLLQASWGRAALAGGVALAGMLGAWLWLGSASAPEVAVAVPDPRLTPGATVLVSRGDVCRESGPKNKPVPVALEHRVLEEYGIQRGRPRAYEIDYLITPALGGADDIRNLWPHSYTNTAWNAKVKDALEDQLHELVCEGRVELDTAQRELAGNWIEAYKKYFHTDRPLETARP